MLPANTLVNHNTIPIDCIKKLCSISNKLYWTAGDQLTTHSIPSVICKYKPLLQTLQR